MQRRILGESEVRGARALSLIVFCVLFLGISYLHLHVPAETGKSDFWMHAGHVAAFSEDLVDPRSTYDESERIRVRNFSPYQLLLALLVRALGLSVLHVMVVAAIVNTAVLFVGVWLLGRACGDDPWLPLGILVAVLFFVGRGFEWSGEVNATTLPLAASYPSFLAVGLTLVGLSVVSKYLQTERLVYLAALVLLSALVFLLHQLIFLYLALLVVCWVLPRSGRARARFLVLVGLCAGVLVSLAWPYFNPVDVAWASVTGQGESRPDSIFSENATQVFWERRRRFTEFVPILQSIGPAVLALPLVFALRGLCRLQLGLALVLTSFLWFAPYWGVHGVPTSGYRWAMAALLVMQLIIGVHLAHAASCATRGRACSKPRICLAVTLAVVLLGTLVYQSVQLHTRYGEYVWPVGSEVRSSASRWEEFGAEVQARGLGDVVIVASQAHSYAMPTFGLRPVIFSRKPGVESERLVKLYGDATSKAEREDLLRELRAEYFITEPEGVDSKAGTLLAGLGEEVVRKAGLVLFRMRSGAAPADVGDE